MPYVLCVIQESVLRPLNVTSRAQMYVRNTDTTYKYAKSTATLSSLAFRRRAVVSLACLGGSTI